MRFPIPVLLFTLISFTGFLAARRKKQSDRQQKANEDFLERERAANAARKKDISSLDYLPFDAARLPQESCPDETLAACRAALSELSGKRILNLSHYSNTDLKLMYGPANLKSLTEYDDNYHALASALLSYARRNEELKRTAEAAAVLEYAMELKIDSSQIYLELAGLYQKQGAPENISRIESALSSMEEGFASPVLRELAAFRTGR